MFPRSKRRLCSLTLKALVPSIVLLGGCASTTVTSSANPSRDRPRLWRDYASLPVIVLGSDPEHTQAELASVFPPAPTPYTDTGRHIVLYVNAATLPAKSALCSDMGGFQPGTQSGQSAAVTGVMCDGAAVVTTATGRVLTHAKSIRWLRKDFNTIRDQLYHSLFPGTNDPTKFQEN